MADFVVRTLQFNPDGSIAFDFLARIDQRESGMMMSRAMLIPPAEELQDLELADMLEDLDRLTQRVLRRSFRIHEEASQFRDDDESRPYDHPDDQ